MTEISETSDDVWRAYYEHPLTAATTAMLNLGGASATHEDPAVNSVAFLYDYCKNSNSATAATDKPDKVTAHPLWTATGGTSSTAGGSSGKGPSGISLADLAAAPSHPGSLEVFASSVKKEPEDLTRRSHDRIMNSIEKGHSSVISRALANGTLINGVSGLEALGHPGMTLEHAEDNPNSPIIHIRRPLSNEGPHDSSTPLMVSAGAVDLAKSGLASSLHYESPSQAFSPTTLTTIQPVHAYDSPGTYSVLSPTSQSRYTTINHSAIRQTSSIYSTASAVTNTDAYYRDYFSGADHYGTIRPAPQISYTATLDGHDVNFGERYIRQGAVYKHGTGLTVDLPSPDSGIGTDAVTPRDQSVVQQQNFDYTELCNAALLPDQTLHDNNAVHNNSDGSRTQTPTSGGDGNSVVSPGHRPSSRSRSWHECGRQNEADKIQIPKVFSQYGFRYYLESPISTSQRREDDRITYINKGQFYGITLEYVPDPERPLKSQTVKTNVMLVFREEKSTEDEAKAWQFWHSRQHSIKQRILDADTKNSVGLVGSIEEISHNAITVYWNPLESSAKINIAVQCLSTDFSSQKGVKGLPLHLQIDTFEDPRDSQSVYHRGYCQIKVFCDKGAERKTRDEERRAAKRKMAAAGRNKRIDELYHPSCERSEFYSMAELHKQPVLFSPAEDTDKLAPLDLQGFYGQDHDRKELLEAAPVMTSLYSPAQQPFKRRRLSPPPCERIMIYVRQENEDTYTPLHLVPPTSLGLLNAIESKYKLSAESVHSLYKKNRKGIIAKIDDDMLKHYCNEDIFLLEISTSVEEGLYDITLVELFDT